VMNSQAQERSVSPGDVAGRSVDGRRIGG
jgi:hypothetical protein